MRRLILIITLGLFAGQLSAQQAYKVTISSNKYLKYYIDFSRNNHKIKFFSVARLAGVNDVDSLTVFAYKKVNNIHYILLWYTYRSHPETPNGECGAGFEEFVASLQVDNALKIKQFIPQQTASCWTGIENDYTFDAHHPERGFTVTSKY